ncbi:hypothetical protein G1C97_2328 [Bifidobacterium sp. DSM 109959]|uniref:Type ISP restriction-modification enzyme LLaBIII C-terminal specificity domain-containing protein n=1 Tax=Bifidobacterium olomucense TaxID=2675324 RepID=A0A7Y0EZQ4_9BIFI|nr:hypothetical protein [Bifidobacterium sp. DSM 109959]
MAGSNATLNSKLYDHYIRAFRWASDRIGDSGIVCFVTNGGWLTGESTAGVRKCFVEEFNSIYVYNLRGNQRTSGEESRREGGKIFESGSRATIAITMLVKNPNSSEHGSIHYKDIGNYLNRQQKLDILKNVVKDNPEWIGLTSDKYGDWLNKRDDSFGDFAPLKGVYSNSALAVSTNRDSWVWNYSSTWLLQNVKRSISAYSESIDGQIVNDDSRIKWTDGLKRRFARGEKLRFDCSLIRTGFYRPFTKQMLYASNQLIERPSSQLSSLMPYEDADNIEIALSGINAPYPFSAVAYGKIPCLTPYGGNLACFPLYWYEKVEPSDDGGLFSEADMQDADEHGYIRHDAITDTGLKVFREAYPNLKITKEDIFYYVYGVLHSPEYRKRFANNLKKELPRIPLAKDFKAFMKAGRVLAHLHLDYESINPWPVMEVGDSVNPGRTEKMTYPKKIKNAETGKKVPDLTVLKVAENLTIEGIPMRAYDYVVNGKSAIGWLIDRYKVTTDKKSGITNDPNDYSDNPRYIVDLVERVIRVSMETLDIVEGLPALEELPHPANWPAEWSD